MDIKIPYAFEKNTNQLKHITDVDNGVECNCYCKSCGEDLIARNNGKTNQPHFSHKNESKCKSYETFLHYFAKIILSNFKELYIPKYNYSPKAIFSPKLITIPNKYFSNSLIEYENDYTFFDNYYLLTNIRIENKLNDIMAPYVRSSNVSQKYLAEQFFNNFNSNQFISTNYINNGTTKSPFSKILKAIEEVSDAEMYKKQNIVICEKIDIAINIIKEQLNDHNSTWYDSNGRGALFISEYAINTTGHYTSRGVFLNYCNTQTEEQRNIFRDNKDINNIIINNWCEKLRNYFNNNKNLIKINELKAQIEINKNNITNLNIKLK